MVGRMMAAMAVAMGLTGGMVRGDVTISAAISLKGALEKAQPVLEKAAGEKVVFNFGASGTLGMQIHQGAGVDVFISADRPTVEKLVSLGDMDGKTVAAVAGNAIVLAVPMDSTTPIAGFADLKKEGVHRVAVGDPKVVPAGRYAKETLVNLKLWEELEKGGKLVMGENVSQVVTFVSRGEVDAGIMYATDAAGVNNVKVVEKADEKLHQPVEYVAAVVSASKKKDAAEKVEKALLGEEVQKVFVGMGFSAARRVEAATKP